MLALWDRFLVFILSCRRTAVGMDRRSPQTGASSGGLPRHSNDTVAFLGIDIGKNTFRLFGLNKRGARSREPDHGVKRWVFPRSRTGLSSRQSSSSSNRSQYNIEQQACTPHRALRSQMNVGLTSTSAGQLEVRARTASNVSLAALGTCNASSAYDSRALKTGVSQKHDL
jgi:hypothetical protein